VFYWHSKQRTIEFLGFMLNNQWSLIFSLYNVNNKNFIGGSMSKEQEIIYNLIN
jgi:hypothetical protein